MQNLSKLRSLSIALCACIGLVAGAPALAQHARVGYAGGWHGGYYGWRGGYYGPWGWWGGYGPWWGGVPYYYADNTYYRWNDSVSQYETVAQPAGLTNQGGGQSAGPSQLVVYPKSGQSQEQQGKDTFECHRWAVGQTGFDPTQGAPGNRSEYFRAQAACVEGRGYTVK